MVYIAYYTELNLQICNYAQQRRFCCKKIANTRLTETFVAIFALAKRLPTSATLSPSNISAYMFPQPLHLAQLEPELLLQPDRRHLPGKVGASNPGDVREHIGSTRLRQRVVWTDEAGLP